MDIYILLVLTTVVSATRKYDIEEEAIKLYGEDLNSVLKRFRRTSDYLKILEEEKNSLHNNYRDLEVLVKMHIINEVKRRIKELLEMNAADDITIPEKTLRFGGRVFRLPNYGENAQRQGEEVTKSPVESLDHYGLLTRQLTIKQINMFKDVGFEYAGDIIHTIIKSMGSEDFALKSTKQSYTNRDKHFTTASEHVHKHEIKSTLAHIISTASHEEKDDDTFRFRNNKATITWAQNSMTKAHHTILP